MWQKIQTYITAVFIFTAIILTGCSGGATNQPSLSANGISNHASAQPMAAGPMPQHIALLLPITGTLAQQGNAIRNGFFAAYYQDKQRGNAPLVKVYDTSQGNIAAVYQQAVSQGANFVVGPLTKDDLSQLVNAHALSVPTLALNTLDADNSRINNLYQFGLSPIDEAIQAARKIEIDGHNRVIIIRQAGDWSNRIADAFEKQWQTEGGHVVETFTFANIADLNNGIPRLLNIEDAQHRAKFLEYVVREKIRFIPRRRKDFDSIFLVATPDQARQVLPLLRFYYAGGVPVYATSLIYSGKPGTSTDYDLGGVMFNDMPWVLQANANLPNNLANIRQGVRTLWPASYDHLARFYGLGVDAYQVIPNLDKLSNSSQTSVIGATGQLYLLPNQHVYRQLEWAKIVNGAPELESP
jgi:outer membrane PBP1 activator LpoA protein